MPEDHQITDLLHAWTEGDSRSLDELMPIVHDELSKTARAAMNRERQDHILEPAALVNETYLRLRGLERVSWKDRTPFLAFSAHLMREILIEHARKVQALKRGQGKTRITLKGNEKVEAPISIEIVALNNALKELERRDPALHRLVELRYFSGLSQVEAADFLKVSRSTVQRDWELAKRFLARALSGETGNG